MKAVVRSLVVIALVVVVGLLVLTACGAQRPELTSGTATARIGLTPTATRLPVATAPGGNSTPTTGSATAGAAAVGSAVVGTTAAGSAVVGTGTPKP